MKIEDFIHRRHHKQHHLAIASSSTAATSAIVSTPSSLQSSSTSPPPLPLPPTFQLSGTTKRSLSTSSLLAINAPSSKKNHKNDETICSTKMSNESNSIINATTAVPIKNGLNGSYNTTSITPIISTSTTSSSLSLTSTSSSSSFNNSSSSSLLSSSSIIAAVATATGASSTLSSTSSSGTNIVAAVTDSRIHVSRANPIHSNSSNQQHHYHHNNNNNGTTISASGATTTTTISGGRHSSSNINNSSSSNSAISRIKVEPVENNGGSDYSAACNKGGGGGGGMDSEIVGRIQTTSSASSSLSMATAAAGTTGSGGGDNSRSGIGGRLQFFKDGKFILELARAKEGEKSGWISVPRKQFRSPSATSSTVTPTYPKNESSTSLSFSDDNSSIQSSPWQRDHCWKQSTPRRGISKEMCFYFKRSKQTVVSLNGLKSARIKRRRPLDNSVCKTPFRLAKNGSSIAADVVDKKVKIDKENIHDKNDVNVDEDEKNNAMDEEEKSSDDSSTEKEGSVREVSKTPTPDSQSSDTVDGATSSSPSSKTESIVTKQHQQITTKQNNRILNGEKRLKSRAKLSTIIQKLLDRLPTGLYHLSKTQIIGGGVTASQHPHSHHQTHSSHQMPSTSSRLASELHYHQQHVSPRKRILREFEKVSLEDSPAANSKRSRAKGNSPASGTMPLSQIPTGRGVAVPSSNSNSNSYVTNGNRIEPTVVPTNNSNITPNSTPTRLYSSYSIHSLLSGNNSNSSNSNNNNANANNRLKVEHSVNTQSSGGAGYNDPSYLRAMLASPKSPEGCTINKSSPYSSSTSGSAKKRSPPYSPISEIHHQHHSRNRSPNVDYGNMRSPPEAHNNRSYGNNTANSSSSRLTPPHGYISSPKNSNSTAGSDGYKVKSENLTNSSPNHHFYSPYMMSPKYVPPPSAISPNNASDTYHPKLKGARSPSSQQQQNLRGGIFRTHSPQATTNHSSIPRESSPIGMQLSPSPGGGGSGGGGGMTTSSSTSTPRTVPKKTVSIRRQFASPSSSSPSPGLSEHLKNAGNSNMNSNSKGEERTAMSPDNRRTPTQDSAAAAAAVAVSKYHQQAAAAAMMQRSSPLGGGSASSLYYMYPPPNGSPSPHHSSSSPSPSPSSSYIPQLNPYYHPYVSTLAALRNPLWMHHYPAAAAAAAAAAGAAAVMMPSSAAGPVPQGVPFFPYNGAAATTPSHLHHSSYAQMHLAAAGQLGLQPPPPPATMNRSPPTTDDRISTSSIKEEHSSDVPLNLSKH
ncbi:protein hairless [Eupeodes corollae]|uniref:protein hairless n=1 Tax=Eupeodes corollae TaxID=290404 RepID=UPI002490E498|nr:protein hairless [Eupeodes corollae]